MTVKLILRKDAAKKDGTFPLVIRAIEGRKVKVISTGYSVKEHQFKDGQVCRHADAVLINASIDKKRNEVLKKKPSYSGTVFGAITALLTRYEARNQVAGHTRLTTNLHYLKEAWGKDVPLSNLNQEWVNKYVNYRYDKGNGDSTVKKNLKDLAVVLNSLEDYEGKNYFKLAAEGISVKPVRRDSLTAAEITALEDVKLDGLTCVARDIFLFAYYAHGMRFESVVLLRNDTIRDGFIRYRMNKGQKIREIAVHEKLQKIIDRYKNKGPYLFPVVKTEPTAWTKKAILSPVNTMMRAYLDRAAILAGIDRHIFYHLARHSFAALGIGKGLSYSILKDALGHTNFSTTQQYLNSLTDIRINDAIKDSGLFD